MLDCMQLLSNGLDCVRQLKLRGHCNLLLHQAISMLHSIGHCILIGWCLGLHSRAVQRPQDLIWRVL